jgi:hypothetical protein
MSSRCVLNTIYFSLCLIISFALKSTLSGSNLVTSAFFLVGLEWHQGFVPPGQVFYYLSRVSSPCCLGYFWDRVSFYACATIPNSWEDSHVLLCPAIGWGGVLRAFCPSWLWTRIVLISAFQVARTIGFSLSALPHFILISVYMAYLLPSFIFIMFDIDSILNLFCQSYFSTGIFRLFTLNMSLICQSLRLPFYFSFSLFSVFLIHAFL